MIDWSKVIIGAVAAGALIWLYAEIRSQGADSVRNAIERQNNAAGSTADDARGSYDLCPDGMWDFAAGRCVRTAPRRGN